jgi:galactose mutarotase-like enzyme
MLTLRAADLEADVVPETGMVVASLRRAGRELLALRAGLEAYREKGSTFGVPLLYPFANRLSAVRGERIDASSARTDDGLPIHGLPAARGPWRVQEADETHVRAVLDWDDPAFPPAHQVEVTHALGAEGLTVTTRVIGLGVPVAFGWHPYLAIDRAATPVSIPVSVRHVLDERGLPTGETEAVEPFAGVLGDRAYDDLFDAPPHGAAFRAGDVEIVFEAGAPYAQVFSPAGQPLIAFEPMTAPTNALISGDHLGASPWELRFRIGPVRAA